MSGLDVTISVSKVKAYLQPSEWVSIIVSIALAGTIAGLAVVHNNLVVEIDQANALRNRCTSPECLDAAVWLIGNQDPNVDACQYFYDNACLGYSKRYPISADAGAETSVLANMRTANRMKLHGVVSTPFKTGQWGDLDKTHQRANAYYTGCIDQYQRSSRSGSTNPILKVITSQLGQDWWVINQAKVESFNHEAAMGNMAVDQNFALFNVRARLGPGEKSKHYLEFLLDESPSFTWATNHASKKELAAFKEIVTDMARLLVRDFGKNPDDPTIAANIGVFVDDVVNVTNRFEVEVHQAMHLGPSEKYEKVYEWSDFKKTMDPNGGSFDFDAYIKKAFKGTTLTASSKVIERHVYQNFIYTRDTLADLVRFKADPNFKRKMNNWLTFRIVFYYMNHLSYEYNHLYRTYYTLAYGTGEFPQDWEQCLDLLTLDMPKALSALYVSRFYKNEDHDTILRLVHMNNHSLFQEIDTLTWMDQTTRDAAKKKLQAVQFKIGKPDEWVDDAAIAKEMERHYGSITLDPTNHFGNVQKLIPIRVSEEVRKLGDNTYNPVDEWRIEMYDTRIEYYERWNEIIIPAGVIQEPLVHPNYPAYMNFGGMGQRIAAPLLRVIDERGQVMDEHNQVKNWWTQTTWKNYQPLKQKMIDFYNVSTPDVVQKKVDVGDYVIEGIRETGSVRQAYISYQRYLERHGNNDQALPSLSHGDITQNFFYAYSSSHCDGWSSYATVLNWSLLKTMPTYLHVDLALAQYDPFAVAFDCPTAEYAKMVAPDEYKVMIF